MNQVELVRASVCVCVCVCVVIGWGGMELMRPALGPTNQVLDRDADFCAFFLRAASMS